MFEDEHYFSVSAQMKHKTMKYRLSVRRRMMKHLITLRKELHRCASDRGLHRVGAVEHVWYPTNRKISMRGNTIGTHS